MHEGELQKKHDYIDLTEDITLTHSTSIDDVVDVTIAHRVKDEARVRKANPKLRSPMTFLTKTRTRIRTTIDTQKNDGVDVQEFVSIEYVKQYARSSPNTILVDLKNGDDFRAKDLKCLTIPSFKDGKNKYLGDRLMGSYIKLLLNRRIKEVLEKKLFVFDTLFHRWVQSIGEDRYVDRRKGQLDYLVGQVQDLIENQLVFIPMLVRKHWIVFVINNQRREFQILDSLWDLSKYEDHITKMINGIKKLLTVARRTGVNMKNVNNWSIKQINDVPAQRDGSSCGLYVLKYIELWNGSNLIRTFTQNDIDAFRRKMLVELIFFKLNRMEEVKKEINQLSAGI